MIFQLEMLRFISVKSKVQMVDLKENPCLGRNGGIVMNPESKMNQLAEYVEKTSQDTPARKRLMHCSMPIHLWSWMPLRGSGKIFAVLLPGTAMSGTALYTLIPRM